MTNTEQNTQLAIGSPIIIRNTIYPIDDHLPEFDHYPFPLDHFQKWALTAILKKENVLVTARTGAGKTLVAEFAIQQGVTAGQKVIYTSPIKSLSNQKFQEFSRKFPDLSVGILTGDIKFNPEAQVLVMTTEILRNLLYQKELTLDPITGQKLRLDVSTEVASIVFDEVHYINDRDRGKVWEECLILLPRQINLVLLSATINRPEIFGQWLQDIKLVPLHLIQTQKRVVPLKHYLYLTLKGLNSGVVRGTSNTKGKKIGPSGQSKGAERKQLQPQALDQIDQWTGKLVPLLETEIVDELTEQAIFHEQNYQTITGLQKKYSTAANHGQVFHELTEFLHHQGMTPALYFVLSRKKCEQYARSIQISLNSSQEQAQVEKIIKHHLYQLNEPEQYLQLDQFRRLKDLMIKGIAYHHSGLVPVFKEIIEILFAQHLIKVLFATETFAVGVNMPTKTVVFTGLSKFNGDRDFRWLDTHEFKQMSGRAGRRGLDPIGHVIILPNVGGQLPSATEIKQIMTGQVGCLRSRLTLNCTFILKAILTEGVNLKGVLATSFLNQELLDRIRFLRSKVDQSKPKLPAEDFRDCEQYQALKSSRVVGFEQFGDLVKLNQKQIKKNRKMIWAMEHQSGFLDKLARYQVYRKTIQDYQQVIDEIETCEQMIQQQLRTVLHFLQSWGYLSISDDKLVEVVDEISPDQVTIKGVMASQVNQCSELLLTEIIYRGWLDEFTQVELAGLLAIFLDSRVDGQSIDTLIGWQKHDWVSADGVPGAYGETKQKLGSQLGKILELANEMRAQEEHQQLMVSTNWTVNLNLIQATYCWAAGWDLKQILKLVTVFEGNWVKDMLKISHLAEEVASLAELVGKKDLRAVAVGIPAAVVRQIVTVDSLYLKQD